MLVFKQLFTFFKVCCSIAEVSKVGVVVARNLGWFCQQSFTNCNTETFSGSVCRENARDSVCDAICVASFKEGKAGIVTVASIFATNVDVN
jgi:hypothetical protein